MLGQLLHPVHGSVKRIISLLEKHVCFIKLLQNVLLLVKEKSLIISHDELQNVELMFLFQLKLRE